MTSTHKIFIFGQLISFFKSPELIGHRHKVRIKDFLGILLLYFLGLGVIAVVLYFTAWMIHEKHEIDVVEQARQNMVLLKGRLGWWSIPAIWLIIPVLEEAMFRLPLVKSKNRIRIGILSVLVYLGWTSMVGDSSSVSKLLLIPAGAMLFIVIAYKSTHPGLIFYASVLIFGLLHIGNFSPLTFTLIPLYLLLVLPQLYMGLLLGYARVKMGFVYGVFLHVLINTPVALSMLL